MNPQTKAASVQHWIHGKPVSSSSGQTFEVLNPEDDSVIGHASRGTQTEIDLAIDSAEQAFQSYSKTGPSLREAVLLRAATLLSERSAEFERLLILETGSPLAKAKMEVAIASRVLKANAGMARRMTGRTYPSDVPDRMSFGLRRPLGVVAGITPFNVPLIKGIKHASMPLVTGNTFVWLASSQTPMIAHAVAKLFHDAGLPDGAFNLVLGFGSEIGDNLVTDHRIQLVSFTGSQAVGRRVQEHCGRTGKRVTLELGGKNPLIVLADADLEGAVTSAVRGGFLFQGQICMASSRVIVERPIFESFSKQFVGAASKISNRGELSSVETMIGPIIDSVSRNRIRDHLTDATNLGAKLLCGNEWNGNRVNPTIVSGVTPSMRMFNEETFGPVVSLEIAETAEHALEIANRSHTMLSAAVYTHDLGLAISFAEQLETGMVHVNDMTIQQEPEVPFGGDGESGFGREGMETGIDDYTQWKWVTLKR